MNLHLAEIYTQFSTCNTQRGATRCTTVHGQLQRLQQHPIGVLQCCTVQVLQQDPIRDFLQVDRLTKPASDAREFLRAGGGTMVSVTRRNKHRRVGVNERGRPVGESHPLAKLTDQDVETIHELREAGLSYAQIAAKFDDAVTVSKSHVRDILNGRRRGQMPVRFKVKACA